MTSSREVTLTAVLLALLAGGCAEPRVDLATIAPEPLPITPPSRQEVLAAVDLGVDFLLQSQHRNGSWGSAYDRFWNTDIHDPGSRQAFQTATVSLCYMALVKAAGQSADVDAAIRRAEGWLLARLPKLAVGDQDALFNVWGHAYGLEAMLVMLQRYPDNESRQAEIRKVINRQIRLLGRFQSLRGGWGYYTWHRASHPSYHATSFMTAAVLVALHHAQEAGLTVPHKTTMLATRALKMARHPDGGFDYTVRFQSWPVRLPNRPPGALARTQACNVALYLYGDKHITLPVIRAWLNRFVARHGWLDIPRKTVNPHMGHFSNAGYYYYFGHYYASLGIELLPPEQRTDLQQHLARILIDRQEGDGSWFDFPLFDYDHYYGTAFALLVLDRCLPAFPPDAAAN